MTQREPSDAEVDARFNELIAQLEDPEVPPEVSEPVDREPPPAPDVEPPVLGWRVHTPPEDDVLDALDDEPPPSDPLPPWHPSTLTLAALALIAGAVVVTILRIAQVWLPWWLGWAALAGFVAGVVMLLTRLPRHRDEDEDDGARL